MDTANTEDSIAGLLATLTSPRKEPLAARGWDDDALADDVATLSYENALRAHSRYRSSEQRESDRTDRSLTGPAFTKPEPAQAPVDSYELGPEESAGLPAAAVAQAQRLAEAELVRRGPSLIEKNLKSASVTIRLSQAEAAQLHKRAAEAGLTVSAYLRSCTFEAESLRAMVKDTLAQLRATTAARTGSRGLSAWLARVLMPWRARREMARA